MKQAEKAKQMMDQISTAYSDTTVKTRPQLQEILLENAALLEKHGQYQLVASKLCKSISWYYLTHQQDFPKAIGILYNQLKGEAVKYDGVAVTTLMMPLWF
ncbi:bacteriocin immunity protein [Enterococcus sp. 669A]|uniref:Bacteriocin immunity protein n=1 Tax=Candidatus Enterococcus moelleringii TaxID=2815325 RepID=A0ABS3LFK7_9ENTE|nr:bacteriocin immunity protein [Enterococcus sp. 669A]MBO1308429.1 bacteriocin immunity protein [Enterococcus sp. 669A]